MLMVYRQVTEGSVIGVYILNTAFSHIQDSVKKKPVTTNHNMNMITPDLCFIHKYMKQTYFKHVK
jgi:hypothetical protein